MTTPDAVYLGDGAYAQAGDYAGEIVLTTSSHVRDQATNVIHLEPSGWRRLVEFVEALRASQGAEQQP